MDPTKAQRSAEERDRPLPELVHATLRGEHEAFREVVRRFERTARAAAFAITRDPESARDAAQEAFAEAFLELHKLRDPAAFPGWFRRIVFKQADRIARRRTPYLDERGLADTLADDRPTPEEVACRAELGDDIRRALARLPDAQRLAATLFYLADQSYAEISDFLVLPLSTIKKRLHDARRRLRAELRPDFERSLPATGPTIDIAALESHPPRPRGSVGAPPLEEISMNARAMTLLLNVTDVSRAVDFYRDALGFTCTNQWKNEGRIRWARVENGAANIMLNEHGELTDSRLERDAYRDTVIYLAVDDADSVYEALQANGYTTSEIFDAEYGLREFHMRDLEGYDLAITSALASR